MKRGGIGGSRLAFLLFGASLLLALGSISAMQVTLNTNGNYFNTRAFNGTNTLTAPVTLTANVSGGSAPYTYNYTVIDTTDHKTVVEHQVYTSSSTSNSFTFRTNMTGHYLAGVVVVSCTCGSSANSSVKFRVGSGLHPSITVNDTSFSTGQYVNITGYSDGNDSGKEPSEGYRFIVAYASNDTIAGEKFFVTGSTSQSFLYKATAPGTFFTYLIIPENDTANRTIMNRVSTESIEFTVSPSKRLNVSISPTNISSGPDKAIKLTSNVSGGTGPYRYQWFLNGKMIHNATNSSYSYWTGKNGTYEFDVQVVDSNNSTTNTAYSNNAFVHVKSFLSVNVIPSNLTTFNGTYVSFNSFILTDHPYSIGNQLCTNDVRCQWTFTPTINNNVISVCFPSNTYSCLFTATESGTLTFHVWDSDDGLNASAYANLTVIPKNSSTTTSTSTTSSTTSTSSTTTSGSTSTSPTTVGGGVIGSGGHVPSTTVTTTILSNVSKNTTSTTTSLSSTTSAKTIQPTTLAPPNTLNRTNSSSNSSGRSSTSATMIPALLPILLAILLAIILGIIYTWRKGKKEMPNVAEPITYTKPQKPKP